MAKHFLDLSAVSESDLRVIMDDAHKRKAANKAGTEEKPLAGKMLLPLLGHRHNKHCAGRDILLCHKERQMDRQQHRK